MKELQVVVGIVIKADQVLLTERAAHKPLGPCWEFPGGKIEGLETPLVALERELLEEIDIVIESAQPLPIVRHQYQDFAVKLHPWLVTAYRGTPRGAEHQRWQWVSRQKLDSLPLPAANRQIVANWLGHDG